MIDTDKYEGRTPGQWSVTSIRDGSIPWNTADEELCADAPLLLEEVKRLQKYEREHKELWDIIANFSPKDSEEDDDIYQQWLDSVSQGYMGSVYEYTMMKQEEMIE